MYNLYRQANRRNFVTNHFEIHLFLNPTFLIKTFSRARASCRLFVVFLITSQAVNSKIVDLLLYNKAVKQSTLLATCMPDPLKKTHLKSLFEMLRVSQDISRICRDFCLFFTDLWDIWGLEMSTSAIICYSSSDFCNNCLVLVLKVGY